MEDFRIELFPTHNEVTVLGSLDVTLIRVIMDELQETPDFPDRQAIWIFADSVVAPSFPEFGLIINLLRDYLRPDLPTKKVGLVVGGGLNRALVEMFRSEALSLPLDLRIFAAREDALAWLTADDRTGGAATA